ncbi:MAG: aminotransferase class V-fold PLP-dependent enzyme [Bacteroidetes bacterium]|nr:aminotransferase class V-fold PLP-dependent enzyme [Bacteroidota bacterium]
METYFNKFRQATIGNELQFETPYGIKKMIYADWVASGRLYAPIEKKMMDEIGPYVGNTHTETSETGTMMTKAYHYAHEFIKKDVNAGPNDVIITFGFGMTAVVNKLQRILGLKLCGKVSGKNCLMESDRPVVFITHMEHHSNHTSWMETSADVVLLEPDKDLLIDLNELKAKLKEYENRKFKIGAFTACSNVTGIETPYHQMAKLMHEHGGVCFVDFAASAPYVKIDMHPKDPMEKLDAIMFSPHKFLGGPGSAGVLIFDSSLYKSEVPDQPGGGTVDWTNAWGEYKYIDDIETREDGGTPGFLQAIKAALCIELRNQMGVENIKKREEELVKIAFEELTKIPDLHILADNVKNRLGIISFYVDKLHFNLMVMLLNDRFGIQTRGGCACAGTYGHFLLNVSHERSKKITDLIDFGDLSQKPGWIRLSLHPTMTNEELYYIIDAIKQIRAHHTEWGKDYEYNKHTNEFQHNKKTRVADERIKKWFSI